MSEDRIVYLPDLHVPFNINLDPVFEFIQDFKPTTVILGGDAHDFTSVGQWIADQSRERLGGTLKENYKQLKSVALTPIQRAAPKAKKIYLRGNHERWIDLAVERDPNGVGFWELEGNLTPEWEIYAENVPYKASKHLYYIHGLYINEFHAKKTALAYHKNVCYGHIHDIQVHTLVSPIDEAQFFKAQSCGCLCHVNPQYMRNKPNKWVNGFNFAYVEKETGYFSDVQVYIVENKFWANGKRYR